MAEGADVVVIGMGPGGEHVAGQLVEAGLDVVGVEANLVGGECPYWGCVPTKMMVRAAEVIAEGDRIRGFAGSAAIHPDWAPVAARIRREATDEWDDAVAVARFEKQGGRFLRGWGRLDGPGRVVVGDLAIDARRAVVLATGAPRVDTPVPGLDDVPYWTNRDAVQATEVPGSLAVLGCGAIGAELAQVFRRFGAEITVIDHAPRLLDAEEPEVGELLARVFATDGIAVHTGTTVDSVGQTAGHVELALAGGPTVVAERVLVAAGRRVDLASLNVGSIGVDETAEALPVDDHLRVVGCEGVWGVGDLTGRGAFTHVARYQAGIAVADILGRPVVPAEYRAVPRVTFTAPEVGAVGLTERTARERGLTVAVGTTQVPSSARGWIHGPGNDGFVKLVQDADRGVLVGATSVGPAGGEVLGLLALAVHAEIPTEQLRQMIYAYPTFHRAIEDALADLD